jgi:hypothetical protein
MWLRLLVAIMAPRLGNFIPENFSLTPNSSLSSMSVTNKHPGGWPPARIISTHFERLKKLPNKSGCYYWKCIYCTDSEGSGLHLEGCDSVLLQHLSNPQSCPNAPPEVRNEARRALTTKGATDANNASVPLFRAQSTSSAGDTNDAHVIIVEQSSTTKALGTKKRKNISGQPTTLIDKFVDHGMTTLHQRTADIKLFR